MKKQSTSNMNVATNQWVGVIVLAALLFLVLVRLGFRGLVVSA